jgi:fucose 4-O-acetylase-like acetyltransferase
MANTQRNATLDIAKGICIILMVIGHSGSPTYLHDFLYKFHMPCFFFISGWLFSDKYLEDYKTGLRYKGWSIYKTYLKWELIFLVCHNLFAACGFYKDAYSVPSFAINAVRVILMSPTEQLVGGYWFLISLFWATVLSMSYLYMLKQKQRLTIINISGG